ncbi:MAG: DsbA family protein [Thiolinea sp.]
MPQHNTEPAPAANPDQQTTLYYVHDPMCSWCYAFRPVWKTVRDQLPEHMEIRYLLGGLAPDTGQPMPESLQTGLQQTWQRITQVVPGTTFNFEFWTRNQPRRATYPACRAVLAARFQHADKEQAMIQAIQDAYYREARNPSDDETLVELAGHLGLDQQRFARDLQAEHTQSALEAEIKQARSLGGDSFPSLIVLEAQHSPEDSQLLQLSYTDPQVILRQLQQRPR